MAAKITCPNCGKTSWNPNDVREGYCGYCHAWTGGEVIDTAEELDSREHNVFRDGKIHVLSEKCAACLFSPQRIVGGKEVAEIVRTTKDEPGAHFICHKAQIADEDAVCAGWYEKFGDKDPIFRMAEAHGVIERVGPYD